MTLRAYLTMSRMVSAFGGSLSFRISTLALSWGKCPQVTSHGNHPDVQISQIAHFPTQRHRLTPSKVTEEWKGIKQWVSAKFNIHYLLTERQNYSFWRCSLSRQDTCLDIFTVGRYVCSHIYEENRIRRDDTDKIIWVMSEKTLWSLVKRWESWRMLSISSWVDHSTHLSPFPLFGAAVSFKETAFWQILLFFVQCDGNVSIGSENQVGTETWSDWIPLGYASKAGLKAQKHNRRRRPTQAGLLAWQKGPER